MEKLKNNKKIVIISISVIIAIIIAVTVIILVNSEPKEPVDLVEAAYDKFMNTDKYVITIESLDKDYIDFFVKEGDKAYLFTEIKSSHAEVEKIVRDGHTYKIDDSDKEYKVYLNDVRDLNKITTELKYLIHDDYLEGTENIEGTEYKYQEYNEGIQLSGPTDLEADMDFIKTRIYFDSEGNIVYIKSYSETKEDLVSFKVSYDVDSSLFEIPEGYQED